MKLRILFGCHELPKSAEAILEAALIRASLADSVYAVAGAASAATRLAVSIANSNPEPADDSRSGITVEQFFLKIKGKFKIYDW
jgi:hypothetical protein